MRRLFPILLGASVALASPAGAAEGPTPLHYGNESAAATDDAMGLLVNPAAAGFRYPSEMIVGWDDPIAGEHRWFGMLARGGFGVALEENGFGRTNWSLSGANGSPGMRGGTRVTWMGSEGGGRVPRWDAGALARPVPWLALGGVASDLNRPRVDGVRLERSWTAAAALRPLALARARAFAWGPRLTLTADATWRDDEDVADARLRFGAEAEVVKGLALRGAVENRRGWQVGLALLSPRSTLHGRSAFDRDHHRAGSSYAVSLHEAEEATALGAPRRVATMRLGGVLGDESVDAPALLGGASTSGAAGIHRQLERALEDPHTRGVLLELRGVAGMAQLEELRPRIARLRAAGKPVVACLEYGGGRGDLYLAAACDRIVASEEAFFAGLGLRAERRSYRSALERFGIRVERSSIGRYKSAYREFSVDSTTDADREVLNQMLDALQESYVTTVCADRRIPRESLLAALDGRAWTPAQLVALGVIDTVGYREDALRLLGRLAGLGPEPRAVNLARIPEARRAWRVPPRIAVVYASGVIETGPSGSDWLDGARLGSETLSRQIEQAFKRRDVGAVVLRVESPGGSANASNLIAHAAERWKRETGKPLIVSMGSVAASGGYYIAAPADRIFADRHTRTGSIGVVYVKPSLEGAYRKLGVRQEVFERGAWMGGLSPAADWDARFQASADSSIARSYDVFVSKVAAGRGLPDAKVREVAEGRVWLGGDAVALGLVDAIGGLEDAIAEARRRAGVPEGEVIAPVEFRRPRPSLVERLVGSALRETWARSLGALEREGPMYLADDPVSAE